jgi:hypothetical protein
VWRLNVLWQWFGDDKRGAESPGEMLIQPGSDSPDPHLIPENSPPTDIRQYANWSHQPHPNTLSKNDQQELQTAKFYTCAQAHPPVFI